MYSYEVQCLRALLSSIIQQKVGPEVWNWLQQQGFLAGGLEGFAKAFMLVPRKTGKDVIALSGKQAMDLAKIRPGYSLEGYTTDRLCRAWLLVQPEGMSETDYFYIIEGLFQVADVNELVALYGSLPVLAYPKNFTSRCAEGIRSNIDDVLQTIICNNPYPSLHLEEPAWNQLVLKAFFTEKSIDHIIGLDERRNQALADTLCDYARERRAASRAVHPQLWRCVAPFISAGNFADIEKAANSTDPAEQKAALLACYNSHYEPAKMLLYQFPAINNAIQSNKLNWHSFANKELSAA